jgi:hypothetical protein
VRKLSVIRDRVQLAAGPASDPTKGICSSPALACAGLLLFQELTYVEAARRNRSSAQQDTDYRADEVIGDVVVIAEDWLAKIPK